MIHDLTPYVQRERLKSPATGGTFMIHDLTPGAARRPAWARLGTYSRSATIGSMSVAFRAGI